MGVGQIILKQGYTHEAWVAIGGGGGGGTPGGSNTQVQFNDNGIVRWKYADLTFDQWQPA